MISLIKINVLRENTYTLRRKFNNSKRKILPICIKKRGYFSVGIVVI